MARNRIFLKPKWVRRVPGRFHAQGVHSIASRSTNQWTFHWYYILFPGWPTTTGISLKWISAYANFLRFRKKSQWKSETSAVFLKFSSRTLVKPSLRPKNRPLRSWYLSCIECTRRLNCKEIRKNRKSVIHNVIGVLRLKTNDIIFYLRLKGKEIFYCLALLHLNISQNSYYKEYE